MHVRALKDIAEKISWASHRVVVKPFPGDTIRDMRSHVVPTIEKAPDQICLHVGTNDLKSSTLNDVADVIIDLARQVEDTSEFEIILSELTARNDDYSDAVKAVNKRLKQFCQQNNWKLIRHANISSKGFLTWHFHIDKLCKKIASAIGAIKRVKPFVPQSILLSIYNSLVQSHFD